MKPEEIREKAEKVARELKSVKIQEWGCEIYFKPVTVADQQYIAQKFNGKVDDNLAMSLETIHLKSLNKEGNRIWTTDEHRDFLRTEVSEKIITRLLLAFSGANIDKAKKNSKKT